jgi:hypothetical protein
MKKRILATIVGVSTIVGLMTGCGSISTATTGDTQTTAEATTSDESSLTSVAPNELNVDESSIVYYENDFGDKYVSEVYDTSGNLLDSYDYDTGDSYTIDGYTMSHYSYYVTFHDAFDNVVYSNDPDLLRELAADGDAYALARIEDMYGMTYAELVAKDEADAALLEQSPEILFQFASKIASQASYDDFEYTNGFDILTADEFDELDDADSNKYYAVGTSWVWIDKSRITSGDLQSARIGNAYYKAGDIVNPNETIVSGVNDCSAWLIDLANCLYTTNYDDNGVKIDVSADDFKDDVDCIKSITSAELDGIEYYEITIADTYLNYSEQSDVSDRLYTPVYSDGSEGVDSFYLATDYSHMIVDGVRYDL